MKRALAIATLLRSKISAKTAAVRGRSGTSETNAPAKKAASTAAQPRFDRKPPEPVPSIPRRVFCGAPRLRDRV